MSNIIIMGTIASGIFNRYKYGILIDYEQSNFEVTSFNSGMYDEEANKLKTTMIICCIIGVIFMVVILVALVILSIELYKKITEKTENQKETEENQIETKVNLISDVLNGIGNTFMVIVIVVVVIIVALSLYAVTVAPFTWISNINKLEESANKLKESANKLEESANKLEESAKKRENSQQNRSNKTIIINASKNYIYWIFYTIGFVITLGIAISILSKTKWVK